MNPDTLSKTSNLYNRCKNLSLALNYRVAIVQDLSRVKSFYHYKLNKLRTMLEELKALTLSSLSKKMAGISMEVNTRILNNLIKVL